MNYPCKINLSKNYSTIIDETDYIKVNKFKWSATKIGSIVYAIRYDNGKFIYLHRYLMNAKDGDIVDHIDGDGLNNSRSNLRIVNKSQNSFNSYKPYGKSKFKGVWYKTNRSKPWIAEIRVNGIKYCLGSYLLEEEAAEAYNNAAIKLVGQYAKLNEIGLK